MLGLSLNPSHSFSIRLNSSTLSTPIPPTSPFTLGLSLSHVLSILTLPNVRALFPRYANATINYHESNPISDPIALTLPLNIQQSSNRSNTDGVSGGGGGIEGEAEAVQDETQKDDSGLHLIFDGKSQRIQMIILSGLQESNLEIDYSPRGQLIHKSNSRLNSNNTGSHSNSIDSNSNHNGLTRAGLHQFLGPTYPGISRSKKNPNQMNSRSKGDELLLSYPGVAFGFDLGVNNTTDKHSKSKQVEGQRTDVDNHHLVSSIYLFHGSTPLSPIPILYPALSSLGSSIGNDSTSSNSWGTRASSSSTAQNNHSRSYSSSYSPNGIGKSSNGMKENSDSNGVNQALMAHINELERGAIGMGVVAKAVIDPGRSVTLFMHPSCSHHSTSKSGSASRSSSSPQPMPTIELVLHQTTPQDVICELGAPQSMHWREDDRLSIHSRFPSTESERDRASRNLEGRPPRDTRGALFYNYFSLGFDLMFSGPNVRSSGSFEDSETDGEEDEIEGEDSTLMKVILHNNVPGSALFGRYGRCCWSIESEDGKKVDFDTKFHSLEDFFENQSSSSSSSSSKPTQTHLSPASSSPASSRPSSASNGGSRSPSSSKLIPPSDSNQKSKTSSSSITTDEISRGRKSKSNGSTLQVDRASSPTMRGLLSGSPVSTSKTLIGIDRVGEKGLDVRTTLHGLDGLVVEEDKQGWIVGVTIV